MDVDLTNIKIHANRFSRGLGRVIWIGKTKYMQAGSVVVLVMSYIWAKKSTFCGLWSILYDIWDQEDGPETAKG